MIEREFSVAGGVLTSWSLPMWTRRQSLADGLAAAGFNKYAPGKRTPAQSLKDALDDAHRGSKFIIVPLKNKDGFEVREVTSISDTENEVSRVFAATIDPSNKITFYPGPPTYYEAILGSFNEHLGLVRTSEVTACLVRIIKRMHGTPFPGGRGLYFLPPDRLTEWVQVAKAVEGASWRKPNNVYVIRHAMDPDAIRAITDGLVHEVKAELAKIDEEIFNAGLGKRALEARKKEALQLEAKIKEYEQLLGVSLSSLKESVEKTGDSILRACMLASASREPVDAA